MIFDIPGTGTLEINQVVFDYNGTIALDGKLIEGVADMINELSEQINFHVITADTFGSVQQELAEVNCNVVVIPKENQVEEKLNYILQLGKEKILCVGNGKNDRLMLKEAALGIALIQSEGVCVETLMASDIALPSVMDVFEYFKSPSRLIATLRK